MRVAFVALLALATQGSGHILSAQATETRYRASAEEVCSFITGKLRDAVPQVPSLCVAKEGDFALFIEVDVFSPTDVLQGKMRRAWSVALFAAAQELLFGNALNGTCQEMRFGCRISVSDAHMARGRMRYVLLGAPIMKDVLHGDPATEEWYQRWWIALLAGRTFDGRSGSKANAELLGEALCESYRNEIQKDPMIRRKKFRVPACSLLLATDSRVYFMIDFPDAWSALWVNYSLPLLRVFGEFGGDLYKGEVVFRGPWISLEETDSVRVFFLYDLVRLGFLWQEVNSGVRDLAEAQVDLLGSRRGGQTKLYSLAEGAGLGAIVRITESPDGRMVLDLTDGSSWYAAPAAQWCLKVGDTVLRGITDQQDVLVRDTTCQVQVSFRGGW